MPPPANMMKVNILSKKLVKPHTPTPQNLKNYNISMIDQFMESMNIGVVLFYKSTPPNKMMQLEESLAKILVQFYILAGRYMNNDHTVHCNDDGAEFIEAEAQGGVAEITDLNVDLLPDQYLRVDEAADDPLLSIQATHFSCGGLAIAVSVSHRVFDVSSLGTFIAAWSKACSSKSTAAPPSSITFNIPSFLPYMDLGLAAGSNKFIADANQTVVKKLVFNKEAITRLRSEIISSEHAATRVRVVCAVIAKALIAADKAKQGGRNRSHVIIQLINMRERTSSSSSIAPQPKLACGNFSIPSYTRRVDGGSVVGIGELVDVIGESVGRSVGEYGGVLESPAIFLNALGNISKQVYDPETNAFIFTDWSKFGFYEADFGWGEPVWTSIGPQRPPITTTVLMSDREGHGIEAWLHLNRSDVPYFDQVEEIKAFTI